MHNPVLVDVGQCLQHITHNADGALFVKSPFFSDNFLESAAFYKLHDEVDVPVNLKGGEHLDDVRMIKAVEDFDLLVEAGADICVQDILCQNLFDGHKPS